MIGLQACYYPLRYRAPLIVFYTSRSCFHRCTYTVVRVSRESVLTRTGVIARYVVTHGIVAACAWYRALVHIFAVHLTVADVAGFAFAQKVRREVATLGVFDATPGERRVVALVDIYKYDLISQQMNWTYRPRDHDCWSFDARIILPSQWKPSPRYPGKQEH